LYLFILFLGAKKVCFVNFRDARSSAHTEVTSKPSSFLLVSTVNPIEIIAKFVQYSRSFGFNGQIAKLHTK